MPRIPAPLTVHGVFTKTKGQRWEVRDSKGITVAKFYEEADARAFVALPALMDAAHQALDCMLGISTSTSYSDAAANLSAALAQADGPAPKE
jgi:hypothetical protein